MGDSANDLFESLPKRMEKALFLDVGDDLLLSTAWFFCLADGAFACSQRLTSYLEREAMLGVKKYIQAM